MRLGACLFGQLGRGSAGQFGLLRTIGRQRDLGGKMLIGFSPPCSRSTPGGGDGGNEVPSPRGPRWRPVARFDSSPGATTTIADAPYRDVHAVSHYDSSYMSPGRRSWARSTVPLVKFARHAEDVRSRVPSWAAPEIGGGTPHEARLTAHTPMTPFASSGPATTSSSGCGIRFGHAFGHAAAGRLGPKN